LEARHILPCARTPRTEYRNFLAVCNGIEPDVLIYKQAKGEHGNHNSRSKARKLTGEMMVLFQNEPPPPAKTVEGLEVRFWKIEPLRNACTDVARS